MKEYKVISDDELGEFEKDCSRALVVGWTPAGSICIIPYAYEDREGYTESGNNYYQAFIR